MNTSQPRYTVIPSIFGNRYRFFCDLSGASFTSPPIRKKLPEEELNKAWESSRRHFNQCHKCGKWVIDPLYNADLLECVSCAPWEGTPNYCIQCGSKLDPSNGKCSNCGALLIHTGGQDGN